MEQAFFKVGEARKNKVKKKEIAEYEEKLRRDLLIIRAILLVGRGLHHVVVFVILKWLWGWNAHGEKVSCPTAFQSVEYYLRDWNIAMYRLWEWWLELNQDLPKNLRLRPLPPYPRRK